jgi:3-deoxy-manno-octulosonate cytidylyltransferase (CMP-KDO synthetase)
MSKKTAILIPARYGSTRFHGKPLVRLNGTTMIRRVFEACCYKLDYDVFVLSDRNSITDLFEPDAVYLDKTEYENGTERCAGAIKNEIFDKYDQFINVQGDMPDVTTNMIEKCISSLQHYPVSTVFTEMPEENQNDPNSVKMVRAGDSALWFGRGMTGYGDWHLGVYGYRRNALEIYPNLVVEREEEVEKLEQIRWLKNGWQIGCLSVYFNGVEINTPEDVKLWQQKNWR